MASILAFLYVRTEAREKMPEILHAVQFTYGKASQAVTKHPAAGEVVAEPSLSQERLFSFCSCYFPTVVQQHGLGIPCTAPSRPRPTKEAARTTFRASKPSQMAER